MNKRNFLLVIPLMCILPSSCREEINLDCQAVNCVALFYHFPMEVKDQHGNPVALDKYFTVRDRKNLIIDIQSKYDYKTDSLYKVLGYYPVLDASHEDLIKFKNEKFEFKGYKSNKLIVHEAFIFTRECCGIVKVSGPGEVILE